MKAFFLTLAVLFTISMSAQTYEISYVKTVDEKFIMDSLMGKRINMLPEQMKKEILSNMVKPQEYTLTYSNGKSLYKTKEEPKKKEDDEDDDLKVGQGGGFKFRFNRNMIASILYKDQEKFISIKQQNIFDKQFLIQDSIKSLEWEITDKTRTVGEFTCKEATAKFRNSTVTACYSEDIPINEGPDDFFGLPGLVVNVSFKDKRFGPTNIAMTEMRILPESIQLDAPKEGEKVTKEEFEKVMKERTEGFRDQNRGGGNGPMRIQIN